MTEAQFAYEVVHKLRDAGFQALWAGGCVRDQLLGLDPHDYDIATDARPDDVRRLFRRSLAVGASFGVIEVLGPRRDDGQYHRVQVATFRVEGPYSDGRRPDRVSFSSAEEDARRRDFTINGLFYDPIAEHVIDYVGGQADLDQRVLRAIGNAAERFSEDKLRLLRAVRFAARFDLSLDPHTQAAIQAMADQIRVVSAERISEEFRKMLTHANRVRAMTLLWDVGLVPHILPELVPMKGLPQGSPHAPRGDLWDHVMTVLGFLDQPSFPLAFAALLHDVGKPRVVGRTPDRYTFHHHEHVGRRMAGEICHRLRLSNAERERTQWLVERHQYLCEPWQMKTSKLKTVLAHPGIGELLALHRADAEATGNAPTHVDYCEQLLNEWSADDLNPPPFLTGHDLIRRGMKPGPRFKEILEQVREAQLEGTIKSPREAMALLENLLSVAAPPLQEGTDEVRSSTESELADQASQEIQGTAIRPPEDIS